MAYRTSIATLATAFPAPPTKDSRTGSGGVQQGRAANGADEGKSWMPFPSARPRGHRRSASLGGFGAADREAVQLKRYSVYIPDDLELPHDSLPSPPSTPPDEEPTTRRLSYQLHSTTTKHPFPSAPSSSTLAHRRRSLANFSPPLSPPSLPSDRSLSSPSSPPTTILESRPPSTAVTRPLPRPTPSASTSTSSQRSTTSKIKRKPVPQFEEDMDVVDDPLWNPTTGKRAGRSTESAPRDSTGMEGQLRRLSVEERNGKQTELPSGSGAGSTLVSGARATKPLPRTKLPTVLAPQPSSPTFDIAPVVRRSGFTFSAPLPAVSSAPNVEDRESATKSHVSSVFNERLSVDTDDRSLRSSSSYAGGASTIATSTSPSLDSWTPSSSSASSHHAASQPTPSSKRVFRPFALLRRKQSRPNISLDSISAPLEAQAPAKSNKQEDELDRWMGIMGGEDEEDEEEPAPRAVSRPFHTLTAAERAARAASRLSILSVQGFGAGHSREDNPSFVSPLVFSVPPLVYSVSSRSSSSSREEGSSISSRPRTLEELPLSPIRHGLTINAEGSEESGLDGEDELSVEGDQGSNGSLDEYVDAPSSRRPSTSSSISSSYTDGSLPEVIGLDPRSEGLDTMMEVDESPTPNPNHSVHATPKVASPPSPLTSATATMAPPPSLFSTFSWTADAPPSTRTSTSTPPISFLAPSDDGHSSSRATSPEPSSKATHVEGKRRTSLTPRPPKPPKSPRRGSKASSRASSSIENVLDTLVGEVGAEKVGLAP